MDKLTTRREKKRGCLTRILEKKKICPEHVLLDEKGGRWYIQEEGFVIERNSSRQQKKRERERKEKVQVEEESNLIRRNNDCTRQSDTYSFSFFFFFPPSLCIYRRKCIYVAGAAVGQGELYLLGSSAPSTLSGCLPHKSRGRRHQIRGENLFWFRLKKRDNKQ